MDEVKEATDNLLSEFSVTTDTVYMSSGQADVSGECNDIINQVTSKIMSRNAAKSVRKNLPQVRVGAVEEITEDSGSAVLAGLAGSTGSDVFVPLFVAQTSFLDVTSSVEVPDDTQALEYPDGSKKPRTERPPRLVNKDGRFACVGGRFYCHVCKLGFSSNYSLNRHGNKQHGIFLNSAASHKGVYSTEGRPYVELGAPSFELETETLGARLRFDPKKILIKLHAAKQRWAQVGGLVHLSAPAEWFVGEEYDMISRERSTKRVGRVSKRERADENSYTIASQKLARGTPINRGKKRSTPIRASAKFSLSYLDLESGDDDDCDDNDGDVVNDDDDDDRPYSPADNDEMLDTDYRSDTPSTSRTARRSIFRSPASRAPAIRRTIGTAISYSTADVEDESDHGSSADDTRRGSGPSIQDVHSVMMNVDVDWSSDSVLEALHKFFPSRDTELMQDLIERVIKDVRDLQDLLSAYECGRVQIRGLWSGIWGRRLDRENILQVFRDTRPSWKLRGLVRVACTRFSGEDKKLVTDLVTQVFHLLRATAKFLLCVVMCRDDMGMSESGIELLKAVACSI